MMKMKCGEYGPRCLKDSLLSSCCKFYSLTQVKTLWWFLTDVFLANNKGWPTAAVGQTTQQLSVQRCPDFELWISQIIFALRDPKVTSFRWHLLLGEHLASKISRAFQICQQIFSSCSGDRAISIFLDPTIRRLPPFQLLLLLSFMSCTSLAHESL